MSDKLWHPIVLLTCLSDVLSETSSLGVSFAYMQLFIVCGTVILIYYAFNVECCCYLFGLMVKLTIIHFIFLF